MAPPAARWKMGFSGPLFAGHHPPGGAIATGRLANWTALITTSYRHSPSQRSLCRLGLRLWSVTPLSAAESKHRVLFSCLTNCLPRALR